MRKQVIEHAAHEVATQIRTVEDCIEDALVEIADLQTKMLRARSAADLARQQRAELLRRLLEGGEDSSLVFGQLGLDPAGPFVVVAFQPEFASGGGDEVRMVRLVDLIALHSAAHQHGTECVVIGDTVYVLFTGAAATLPGGVESMARRLVSRAVTALRAIVRAAIGSTVTSVGAISRSRHDADLVLMLLAAEPSSASASASVASVHDVRSRVTLLELGRVLRDSPRLVSLQARRVLDLDARSGTDYAKTLRTYLDCARDSAQAAARLSVHQNTLRYRLRRATELFGIDLASPDDTLTLWLSLRVAEFD